MTKAKGGFFSKLGFVMSCGVAAWLVMAASASAQPNSQQIYLECLTNFETYAESIWHSASYSDAPPNAGYWGDGHSSGNGGIRGNSGIAVAYAVLVVAQPDSPRNPLRLSRIEQALNYDTETHVTGSYNCVDGHHWGWSSSSSGDWQTPMWAASMGLACLLVQSNLPPQTVAACQRVVASEATHRAGIAPASGYIGDTKAEENAWQGNVLALAAAWMTNNPNASLWLTAAKKYLVNTYTVPDTNGDPLASWVTTQTLYPSFALENHGFYHPAYEMVAGMSAGDSLLMAHLANAKVATELQPFAEHNVLTVWRTNLQYMVMDSGEFAYPAGLDWELHDYEQNSYIAWMAAHFDDPLARWDDGQLAKLERYRQLVNGNGEFVGPSGGGFYREAVEARRTAIAWLHWAHADYPTGPEKTPAPAVVKFPRVKIIAQRSASGFASFSYGSRIMGMVEPAAVSVPTNVYVATPALPGGFACGPLGNPTSATLVSFTTNATGFAAELMVQNGSRGSTRVYVKSTGQSVGVVEVPLPAAGVTVSNAGCFTNGIENDPLTGGSRRVQWAGNSAIIDEFSGISTNLNSPWVCVSRRYGVVSGPEATFNYHASNGYNRPGAAQDYLSVIPKTRFGPRYCVWLPGQNTAQTAASANQITWTTNGNTAVLHFPGPGGATEAISAVLSSGNGTWTSDSSGDWSDASKWAGGNIADGAGSTADFTTLNITANRTVTLDSSRTIGVLGFGDTSGTQDWILNSGNGSVLTLAGSPPYIAVLENTATINAPLAGTGGLTKAGPGTLVLAGTNSLSGTLHVDTASYYAKDGILRIASSAAVANVASPILIQDNNSASSTLQLDGASGAIQLAQDIDLAGRNVPVPAIENVAGDNTLSGNLALTLGGGYYMIQSDSGTLTNRGVLPTSTPGGLRTLTFLGNGNQVVSGVIQDGTGGGTVALIKTGSGTMTLEGDNTYSGPTTVSNGTLDVAGSLAGGTVDIEGGTLQGRGVIGGSVDVQPGGTVAPGADSPGSLTVNGSVTSEGTVLIRLNKSSAGLTNDSLHCRGDLNCGGTLQLAVWGDPLTVGDQFKPFDAAGYTGAFATITPARPGVGLLWDTNRLGTSGTLSVKLGAVDPQFSQIALNGTNLVWRGSGGAAAAAFSVLSSTNLQSPVTNWGVVAVGRFDSSGDFSITNGLPPLPSQRFFVLRIP